MVHRSPSGLNTSVFSAILIFLQKAFPTMWMPGLKWLKVQMCHLTSQFTALFSKMHVLFPDLSLFCHAKFPMPFALNHTFKP